ncbi:adenylate/guanylate cyclase domain-containing protein [Haliangium sp. UPWRP_2]|uniref:adenylate/guanylate cyclase domain-containing protein n=1 Tax=Haliangium sp. UPWRP_2 TaxID=1931276 RepID=UPI000D0DB455|nr:adenylate/guanylate cyclase domain-containing protein [Haliangium sp. UPWRP_2]PSM32015.1 hypothetical protein BVG81_002490 [Haliangium sp. UPWRP_2]
MPAEAWFHFAIDPGAESALLISSDIYTLKGGELLVYIDDQPVRPLRADDEIASRPYYDGRLALPIPRSTSRPTEVRLRMTIRDSRQLAHPERQILFLSGAGAQREQAERWFAQGIYTGLMLIMALYHAFLWWAERSRAAAWYSLALISLALYYAGAHNLLALLPLRGSPWFSLWLHPAEGPLFAVFYLQFIRSYLRLGRWGEQLMVGWVLSFTVITLLASILHHLYSMALAATLVNGLGVLASVFTVGLMTLAAIHGDRSARILAWSTLAPLLGILVQVGSVAGLLPSHGWPTAAMQVGITSQVVLLGLALSDRIRRLRVDRDQAEAIVRLTLPDPIAERLKQGEVAIADRHAQVAVLFADLAGFTPLSASHPPETLVRLLDALFSEMDALAHRVGAEKIKTIGDCYMVVAGAPRPHPDPVAALADLALALPQATARAVERVRQLAPELPAELPLRVGLHVGPVVAGVLGKQKLAYDLWGDTVNIASRMESHGVVGRIQCTEQVVQALGDRYCFEARGEINVRGKGPLAAFFLLSRKAT